MMDDFDILHNLSNMDDTGLLKFILICIMMVVVLDTGGFKFDCKLWFMDILRTTCSKLLCVELFDWVGLIDWLCQFPAPLVIIVCAPWFYIYYKLTA